MKILVTGADGFLGKNLIAELRNRKHDVIFEYDKGSKAEDLGLFCKEADYVFHLAGVNRPQLDSEFMTGNVELTKELLENLKKYNNKCPIVLSSSIQAELNNAYGESKKKGEDLILKYCEEMKNKALVYRFPNIFGKWCKPNYNSAIATFCYNIARNMSIQVNDPDAILNLVYIDDVVTELINGLDGNENTKGLYCEVPTVYTITLGEIVNLIYSFNKSREDKSIPNMAEPFVKKLYSTYLSYLPEQDFSYKLISHVDERGSFTEFLKTPDRGQISINISKPGIVKGNHWHHTKNEKFLVVSGSGIIRFRKLNSEDIIEYHVSGNKMEVIDIPVGYTHNIENVGTGDMVTVMWANESFDPEKPDTYYLEV